MPEPERRDPRDTVGGRSGRFDIGEQRGHNVNNVGRDQVHYRNRYDYRSDNPYAGLRGVGRLLVGVGMLLGFVGFVLIGYPIVHAIAAAPQGFGPPRDVFASLPLGAGLFFAGVVIVNIGMFISGGRNRGDRR